MAGFTFPEYVTNLRTFLKDKDFYNILIGNKEESTDDPELELYVKMGINMVNMIPPYGVGGLFDETNVQNSPATALIILESTWNALVSNDIMQSRNDLPYNNGGVSIQVEDRHRYIPIINELWKNLLYLRQLYATYKKSINISSILSGGAGGSSGVPSPYADLCRSRYVYGTTVC